VSLCLLFYLGCAVAQIYPLALHDALPIFDENLHRVAVRQNLKVILTLSVPLLNLPAHQASDCGRHLRITRRHTPLIKRNRRTPLLTTRTEPPHNVRHLPRLRLSLRVRLENTNRNAHDLTFPEPRNGSAPHRPITMRGVVPSTSQFCASHTPLFAETDSQPTDLRAALRPRNQRPPGSDRLTKHRLGHIPLPLKNLTERQKEPEHLIVNPRGDELPTFRRHMKHRPRRNLRHRPRRTIRRNDPIRPRVRRKLKRHVRIRLSGRLPV